MLDLDADPVAVDEVLSLDPVMAKLVAKHPGRRVPRTADPAEFAVRAILGQQVSTTAARTHAGRLVSAYGDSVPDPHGGLTHLFPTSGAYAPTVVPNLSFSFFGDAIYHAVLPAVTLFVTSLGGWILGMRNTMINTLGDDYITFAQANGLKGHTVALRYAARNAILPNLTGFGLALGGVVGGSILVEQVFGYPGVGYLLFNAVINQDYPLMQALFLIITVSVLIANFLVDILYGILDPRTRR